MAHHDPRLIFPEAQFRGFSDHRTIALRALDLLGRDARVAGLYLSGSFAAGHPDQFSDVDINVLVDPAERDQIVMEHTALIHHVAPVATVFPATHLNDPNQIIVYYEQTRPIHVDYQYRVAQELIPTSKYKDIAIVLDPDGRLAAWKAACHHSGADKPSIEAHLEYLEARFWGWCWYTVTKIERGELWEARDAIEYMRSKVIIALAYFALDLPNEGSRRLEKKLPDEVIDLLNNTVPPGIDKQSYREALLGLIAAYVQLFQDVEHNASVHVDHVKRHYFVEAVMNPG